jgi:hypothetical protein
MERMRMALVQLKWMSGWCGMRRREQICVQRTAEGGGSLLYEYTDRGPDTSSPCWCFMYFPYATYPLGMHGVSRDINKQKRLGHVHRQIRKHGLRHLIESPQRC